MEDKNTQEKLIDFTLRNVRNTSVSGWAVIDSEDNLVPFNGRGCFSAMWERIGDKLVCNIIQKDNDMYDPSCAKEFMDYMINRSPFKDCYVSVDLDAGYSLHRTDINGAIYLGALTLQRILTENDCALKTYFSNMVATGIPENFAVAVGHFIRDNLIVNTPVNDNHTIFSTDITCSTIANFVNGEFTNVDDSKYITSGKTTGVHHLFSTGHGYRNGFYNWLYKHTKQKLGVYKDPFSGLTTNKYSNCLEINKLPEIWEAFKKEFM